MRKIFHSLAAVGSCLALALVGCTEEGSTPSEQSTSSTGGQVTTVVIDGYGSTLESLEHGWLEASAGSAEAGDSVTYTLHSYDAETYVPAYILVNGETYQVDAGGSVSVPMAEGGNTVTGVFQAVADNFVVVCGYNSIEIEAIENAEYRIRLMEPNSTTEPAEEWGDWGTQTSFTGLITRRNYEVGVRILASDDSLASAEATRVVTAMPPAQSVIDALNSSLALKAEVTAETYSFGELSSTITGTAQSILDSSQFGVQLDLDTGSSTSEYYYRGSGSSVVYETVNYRNEVEAQTITSVTFESMFPNPFAYAVPGNFTYSAEDQSFAVDVSALSGIEELPYDTLGVEDTVLTSVTIQVDEHRSPIGLEWEGYFYSSSVPGTVTYLHYDGDLVDADEVEIDRTQPYETQAEHQELYDLFAALQGNNYTAYVNTYGYVDITAETLVTFEEDMSILVTEEGFVFNRADGTVDGLGLTADGYYVVYSVEDGTPVATTGPTTVPATYQDNYTPWSFAPEVFEVVTTSTGHYFQLIDDVNLYNYASYTLPDAADRQTEGIWILDGTLQLQVTDDGAVFSYTFLDYTDYSMGIVTIEVTDIGTTVNPYGNLSSADFTGGVEAAA